MYSSGGRGVFFGVSAAFRDLSNDSLQSTMMQIFSGHLQNAASIAIKPLEQPFLYDRYMTSSNWCEDKLISRLSWWLSILKASSYDFQQIMDGAIPLLSHSLFPGADAVETVRLLLAFGANVHAIDDRGRNSLHCAITSSRKERFPDVLERKFRILIEAGCNVNHCATNDGSTPSDLALDLGCWDEWCMALESNGLEVSEVIQEDTRLKSKIAHTSRDHSKQRISAGSQSGVDCLTCKGLDNGASDDGGLNDSELDHDGLDDSVSEDGRSLQTKDSGSCLCPSCRKFRALRYWLNKKAALVSCYNEIRVILEWMEHLSSMLIFLF